MSDHVLRREQWIPLDLERAFDFFARAQNLQRITPDWLHFRFVGEPPGAIELDTRIAYRLRIAGVPVRWHTWIAHWDPPHGFVDVQERGPYAHWRHLHRLERRGDGVLMTDVVEYRLPLGPVGRLVHWAVVRAMLGRIFDHRYEAVRRILTPAPEPQAPR